MKKEITVCINFNDILESLKCGYNVQVEVSKYYATLYNFKQHNKNINIDTIKNTLILVSDYEDFDNDESYKFWLESRLLQKCEVDEYIIKYELI